MTGATAAKGVRLERSAGERIARVVIDAGKGNVITSRLAEELEDALAEAARDPALCALLLDHAGKDFSFGASVAEHAPGEARGMLRKLHAAALALLRFPAPVLACVRGRCLGGGFEIVQCATLVFAAPEAVFAQPEIQLGVFAPLGTLLLPRLCGPRQAAELLLSGRSLGAEEAERLGLVHSIGTDPAASARAWALKHLAPRSASSLRHALGALRGPDPEACARELHALEELYLERLMKTHDAAEGIRAFLEKRDPTWRDQ